MANTYAYRCLMCGGNDGEPNGDDQNWIWIFRGGHRFGPCCSDACALRLRHMATADIRARIFGDAARAGWFLYLLSTHRIVEDGPLCHS